MASLIDWEAELAEPLYKEVLDGLGNDIVIEVITESTRTASGKKVSSLVESHTGKAVMGGYATQAEEQDSPLIKAGDTKFVAQFDDTFEPDGKLDEKIIFGGERYTISDAKRVNPDGTVDIVWIVYARRVN